MISLTRAADDLIAAPRPILCLDTCDFLDVVERFAAWNPKEANFDNANSFLRTSRSLLADPGRVQVVVTYLVRHEFDQNIDEARRKAIQHIGEIESRVGRIGEACGLLGLDAPDLTPRLGVSRLVASLVDLSESLLDQAAVLEKDGDCVQRALERVMDRKRPSHKGEIKDSIHWEHYLALSRTLKEAGHSRDRIFVSANKADFCESREKLWLHHDLKPEADAVGLEFFGKLEAALGRLGI